VAAMPAPLACDGQVTFDPASRSLSVRVSGFGGSFWRRGHAAMLQAEETGPYYAAPTVWAQAPAVARLCEASLCEMAGCGSSSTTPTIGSCPAGRICLRLSRLTVRPAPSWVFVSAIGTDFRSGLNDYPMTLMLLTSSNGTVVLPPIWVS
jgi:hypothetical protein